MLGYLAASFVSLTPARLTRRNAKRFAQSSFSLLSKATEEDYVALFDDVVQNIVPLARLATFNEGYRWAGLDHGEPSAFFDFIHRRTIDRSYFAGTLFRLLSDPSCCRAIVRRDPANVIAMLSSLSESNVVSTSAAQLVQELVRQSVLNDDSMLAREVGYKGFAAVGLTLEAMCGDFFVIRHYEPLRGLQFTYDIVITEGVAERLAAAIVKTWKSTEEIWHPQSLWVIESILESVLRSVRFDEIKQGTEAPRRLIKLYDAVADVIKSTNQKVARYQSLPYATSLYEEGEKHHRNTISSLAAEIAVDSLLSLSNEFEGFDDRHWMDAHEIMRSLFPSIGSAPDGLSPVQHAAIKIMQEKLRDNMNGYYPALTRLLLALIGPYRSHHQTNRTAFCILEDMAYFEWKSFARLAREHPDKLSDYLPPNISYDAGRDALVHTYRSGNTRTTALSDLALEDMDLDDPGLRQAVPDQSALQDG